MPPPLLPPLALEIRKAIGVVVDLPSNPLLLPPVVTVMLICIKASPDSSTSESSFTTSASPSSLMFSISNVEEVAALPALLARLAAGSDDSFIRAAAEADEAVTGALFHLGARLFGSYACR